MKTEKRKILLGAKDWVKQNLPVALKLKNESYSKLLILSTIDCFAQMWGNYPSSSKNSDNFCCFVLKYSSQSNQFKQICPTTLHYHYAKNTPLKLQAGHLYDWDDPVLEEETNRMLCAINPQQIESARRKHSYIKLLYQLRNKLVHEMDNIGTPISFSEEVPSIASGINEHGERIWTFNYPRLWLYRLAEETIFHFIDDCLMAEELIRFLDNKRTSKLTWYT